MGALSVDRPTLLDVAKRLDPDGSVADIAELLSETNEVLQDIPFIEANEFTGHKTTLRTGIPTPTWRLFNQYVNPGKSRTAQLTFNTGNMEAFAVVDVDLAKLNGNTQAFRISEDKAHIIGMNEEFSATLFYGNEGSAPAEFTGLTPFFNSKTAESGANLIDGGGVAGQTDCNSIWLVGWDSTTIHGIYPKGSQAGLTMTDDGIQTETDSNGGKRKVYQTHYKWECGLVVRDWRYAVRIHSVDVSTLTKNAASGADLIDLMTQAVELLPSLNLVRPAFYVPRTIRSFLRRQIVSKVASSTLMMDEVSGKKVVSFDGIPVRRCDALGAEDSLN